MAIYRYGDMELPEIPASDLPYVHISANVGYYAYILFSSEPIIAMDVASGIGQSLMGRYGFSTMSATPTEATIERYVFEYKNKNGWAKHTNYTTISNSSMGGTAYGGENGKKYFLGEPLQNSGSWCNHPIMWVPDTVIQEKSDDAVLVKETFPIKAFTELLMAGVEASSAFPMPGSGGDS